MLNLFKYLSITAIAVSSALTFSLSAAPTATAPQQTQAPVQANDRQAFFTSAVLQNSANAALSWLKLVDSNRYAESWDQSATLTKLTVSKDEWLQILEKTRRPLGSVISRQVVDQRTAIDPSGMPKGYYIVMLYKTQFSHKTGYELLTLYDEDNQWSVLTYQIDTQ